MTSVATVVDSKIPDVTVESKLLGTLSVPGEQTFTFEGGIFGFPEAREFALLATEREGMFWLQSLDFEALTFLLVDPFRFVEGYSVDLGPLELSGLLPQDASEILLLSIITLPKEPEEPATVNLQGPLALNLARRRGKQVVIQDSPYGIRYPVELGIKEKAS